jgi:diaminopimelate decarboxylase
LSSPETARRPHLAFREGRLEMNGLALAGLLESHPTPFFLVSERRLVDNRRALAAGLTTGGVAVTLRYCAKANSEAGVLAVLAREGTGLLASHLAEVELALASGFAPETIAFQRPVATAAEIEAVVAAGVGMVHVFRRADVAPLARLAERRGVPLRLSLRLRGAGRFAVSPLARLNARLGLCAAEARDVALACRESRWLELAALNVYVGTQQSAESGFDAALGRACGIARAFERERLAAVGEINLGGGVPSPSLRKLSPTGLWARWRDRRPAPLGADAVVDDDGPERLEAYGRRLAARSRRAATRAGIERPPTLAAEPGRSLVGNAMLLVTRVVAADDGWLFLDASRNFLGESPFLFRRTILPLVHAGRRERFVHLSGGTLNTTDVLDLRRRLPALEVGEALAFCDAGSYTISRATRYAGTSPAIVLHTIGGELRRIRRPESLADLVAPMAPALAGRGEPPGRA